MNTLVFLLNVWGYLCMNVLYGRECLCAIYTCLRTRCLVVVICVLSHANLLSKYATSSTYCIAS